MSRLTLDAHTEKLPLKKPFRISGYLFTHVDVVRVTLRDGALTGRGEAAGVYYLGDDTDHMMAEIEAARAEIEAGATRTDLQGLMAAGGARNAIDCAFWELESRRSGRPVWQLAGLPAPRPLVTTFTLGADDPAVMAEGARAFAQAKSIKLKLTGEIDLDIARVSAIRAARPEAYVPGLVGRFDIVNIKLDKCGGLTEALAIAREARRLGLGVMVGNMVGTSLAMAPAFVVGQLCDVVDLDGPIVLARDHTPGVIYEDGMIHCPEEIWGVKAAAAS